MWESICAGVIIVDVVQSLSELNSVAMSRMEEVHAQWMRPAEILALPEETKRLPVLAK